MNSACYIIISTFLKKSQGGALFTDRLPRCMSNTFLFFLNFGKLQMYCCHINFAVKTFLIIAIIMGWCSLQYVYYLSFSCLLLTDICIILIIGVANELYFCFNFAKRHYWFILYFDFFSASPLTGRFPFSCPILVKLQMKIGRRLSCK